MAKKSNWDRFPGQLSYPIMAWPNRLDPESFSMSDEDVWREKLRALLLVAQHYGVDISKGSAKAFATLTMCVLEDFGMPAFQVAATPSEAKKWMPRRRGRPQRSGKVDRFQVMIAVDIVCERPEFNVWTACKFLSTTKLFKKQKPETLERAYYKALAEHRGAMTLPATA